MSELSINEIDELAQFAGRLADAARAEILPYFRSAGLGTVSKAETFDPVTEADRAAEAAMRDLIGQERPDDAILGEEFGVQPGQSGLTWILDPIDGTRGFISGTPTWGVLVSLVGADGPLLGVIDQPYIGERFLGANGRATLTGPLGTTRLSTASTDRLSDATLFTTFPEIGTAQERSAFERVSGKVKLVRYGMDCYAYALVAAGQVDLVIEAGLQSYDIAAPIAVIEAAGGLVTDWQGRPVHEGGRAIAAANASVHAAALELLAP